MTGIGARNSPTRKPGNMHQRRNTHMLTVQIENQALYAPAIGQEAGWVSFLSDSFFRNASVRQRFSQSLFFRP